MTVRMPHQRDRELRAAIGQLAAEIEAEMRRLGIWSEDPPGEEEVLAGGAFGHTAVPFEHWIQVVLLARLRAVAAGTLEAPRSSSVGTQALREWDGLEELEHLRSLLSRLDGIIVRGGVS